MARNPELVVIDHRDPSWLSAYGRRYTRRGRENGAATYSREIVEHHLPLWQAHVPPGTVISTCPVLAGRDIEAPVVAQYLHTYPLDDPTRQAREVADHFRSRSDLVLFVVAYRALHLQLRAQGFRSLYVPMAIDSARVQGFTAPEWERHDGRRAVYFGNVTKSKRAEFDALRQAFAQRSWQLDVISDGKLDGRPVSQHQAWGAASRYRYGVGVGRCALELSALGLHVMVSGAAFGGLVTTEDEWEAQTASNFNGRVTTFDRDRGVCLDSFDQGLIRPQSNPIQRATSVLRDGLIGLTAGGWL